MKNISSEVFEKTKQVLFIDKVKSPAQIAEIIAPDIYYVLKQYFDLKPSSYSASIHVLKDGGVDISIVFRADRVLIKKESKF